MNRVSAYIKLLRLPGLGGLAIPPVFGAISVGVSDPSSLAILFSIGCFAAIFGFVNIICAIVIHCHPGKTNISINKVKVAGFVAGAKWDWFQNSDPILAGIFSFQDVAILFQNKACIFINKVDISRIPHTGTGRIFPRGTGAVRAGKHITVFRDIIALATGKCDPID